MLARWPIRCPLLFSLSLATIIWHPPTDNSAFAGALGLGKEILKTACGLRPRKAGFEKAASHPGADLLTAVPATDLETALYPWSLSCSSIWLWFCHQHHTPRDPGEACTLVPQETDLRASIPLCTLKCPVTCLGFSQPQSRSPWR